jgi:predicted phage-related endonuclease
MATATNDLVAIDGNGCPVIPQNVITRIVELERDMKVVQEQEKKMREDLKAAMEEYGIVNLKTDEIQISYTSGGERETFDTAAFKADFAELYAKYTKKTAINPTVKIALKGAKQ